MRISENKPSKSQQANTHAKDTLGENNGNYSFKNTTPQAKRITQLQELANNHVTSKNIQRKTNNTGLPDQLKTGVEYLSGMAIDDVKVHYNSPKPAQLQAHAYAQGTQIHVAPGQEKHLPHEAWHVVQQKQGRVKPTKQLKAKVAVNDDPQLEKEADVMGAKALQPKMKTSSEKIIHRGRKLSAIEPSEIILQRKPAVVQFGNKTSKADEDAIFENEYKAKVAEATVKLKGKLAFGAAAKGTFDKRYWKQIPDESYGLAIETTVRPSVALTHLMSAAKGIWSFDCAEYVQVCNLYATMEVYGEENVDQKMPLILRQHNSTPFKFAGVTFDRADKGAQFDAIFHKAKNAVGENFITEAVLLRSIPAGSRVCFNNPAAPDTPFRNENAVYLGGGKYAAHPMGSGLTAENIIDELVRYNEESGLGGADHGRSRIFVNQVEIYASIPMGRATKEALGLSRYERFL